MTKAGLITFFGFCFWVSTSVANSYLDMITQKPEGYEEVEKSSELEENISAKPANSLNNLWYDSRIVTKAPVVTSPYPKYYAWARAKANENDTSDADLKEGIQNLIWTIEGGAAAFGIYEIYRYRH